RSLLRDLLGVSIGRYMRESRLSEAAKLLQNSEFNVSEIGEKCGFESLYAFSRAFRKAYGLPPRAYRQLVHQGAPPPAPDRPLQAFSIFDLALSICRWALCARFRRTAWNQRCTMPPGTAATTATNTAVVGFCRWQHDSALRTDC